MLFRSTLLYAADFTMDVAATSGVTTGGDYTALPAVIGCTTTGASGSVGAGLTLDLNFKVKDIVFTNAGDGYQTTPTVTIGPPVGTCGTGTTATGTTSAIGQIEAVNVTTPGSGYTSAPTVTFTGGGGNGAVGIAVLSNSITGITITASGTGYNPASLPTIVFPIPSNPATGITAVTATGTAVVNSAGDLSGITITQGGTGYSASDTGGDITIDPSGVILSMEITDTGYGYTGQPFVTYPAIHGGTGATQISMKGFVSRVQLTDAGSG